MVDNKPKAFVIMPFGDEYLGFYNVVIKRAFGELGFEVSRADETQDIRNILHDIIDGIVGADIIVADLSGLEPNVMYELGISHGLDKPTMLFTRDLKELPFDLKIYRTFEYKPDFSDAELVIDRIREFGGKFKEGEIKYSNPVIDFIRGQEEILRDKDSGVEIVENDTEKGFIDYAYEGIESLNETNTLLLEVASSTRTLSDKIKDHTEKMREIKTAGKPDSHKDLYALSIRIAEAINENAAYIEDRLPLMVEKMDIAKESYVAYVDWYEPDNNEHLEVVKVSVDGANSLLGASKEAESILENYIETVNGLNKMKISKGISRATKRLSRVLSGLLEFSITTQKFCEDVLAKIKEKGFEISQ